MTDSGPYFQSVGGFLSQKHILDSKYFTDLIKAKWGGICNKCVGFHIEVYIFMNEENPKAIHEYLDAAMGGYITIAVQYFLKNIWGIRRISACVILSTYSQPVTPVTSVLRQQICIWKVRSSSRLTSRIAIFKRESSISWLIFVTTTVQR